MRFDNEKKLMNFALFSSYHEIICIGFIIRMVYTEYFGLEFHLMPKTIYLPPLLAFLAGSVDFSRPTAELWKMHLI